MTNFEYFFRGRRKPEMLNIGQDRDRSAPTLPPAGIEKPKLPVEVEKKVEEKAENPKNFKNRIDNWTKNAEQDAEIGEKYLDKKREMKSGAKKSIVPETDVMKTMKVVEDASDLKEQANPRKKTPPGGKLLN